MNTWTSSEQKLLDTPLPRQTNTYKPVSHRTFIETIQNEIGNAGLIITDKSYLTNMEGTIMTGQYKINTDWDNEMSLSVGFSNSYDKSMRASVQGGAMILVCKNGMYSKGSRYTKKHMGGIQTEIASKIKGIIQDSRKFFDELVEDREDMKKIEIDRKTIANLVGDMYINESLVTSTQLNILKKEIDFSEHFKEKTAWSFYNWTTEAFKNTHPRMYISDHLKLHTYMSDKFKLKSSRGLYA